MMRRRDFLGRLLALGTVLPTGWQPLDAATPTHFEWHVVRSGETLSSIAVTRGVSVASLKQWNHLKSDLIRSGQRLKVRPTWVHLRPDALRVRRLDAARWKNVVVHHSATTTGNATMFDAHHRRIRRMENGLGYHFVIGNGSASADGQIEVGPRWKSQINGGHVASLAYNDNSLGICLVGNFEQKQPTRKQFAALVELVSYLKNDLLDGKPKLYLHRELKGEHTLCPGRHFPAQRLRNLV